MRTYDPKPLFDLFPETSPRQIAAALDVTLRTVQRWKAGQVRLNEIFADRLACRLGVHPANIWPEWFNCDA